MLVSGIKVGKTGGAKLEVDVMTGPHLPNIVLLQNWTWWDVAWRACFQRLKVWLASACLHVYLSVPRASLLSIGLVCLFGLGWRLSFPSRTTCCAVLCCAGLQVHLLGRTGSRTSRWRFVVPASLGTE